MTTMPILVKLCIWVLGFYKLGALGVLMGSLEFFSPDCDKLLCSCLCLFDAIDKLHDMNKKIVQWLMDNVY